MLTRRVRRAPRRTPLRPGFTFVEIVVTLAIMAMLAAVIVPVVARRVREGQSTAVAQTLDAIADGIAQYRTDVRRYPTRLQHLTTKPALGARDPCGRTIPQAFLDEWKGPYLQTQVTASGIRISDATVQDTITSDPAVFTTTSVGYLLIDTQDVDEETAEKLDDSYDGADDLATGVIRFTDLGGDRGTLEFGVRVRGC
jgi:general secretion pathway protein G